MARMARFVAPGYPHHVTQRVNFRQITCAKKARQKASTSGSDE